MVFGKLKQTKKLSTLLKQDWIKAVIQVVNQEILLKEIHNQNLDKKETNKIVNILELVQQLKNSLIT